MKRILQVSNNHFVAGGSDRYYFEISKALRVAGNEVLNFAAKDKRNEESPWQEFFPDAPIIENANARDLPRYMYSRSAKRCISRLLDQETIDVAHLHIYYGRLTASIIGALRQRNIPIVQTLHEYKLICAVYSCMRADTICESCRGRSFWKATRYRCNKGSFARSLASSAESYVGKMLGTHDGIDHFIAVSEFQRGRILEHSITKPADITTVHNFVDPERLHPEPRPGRYALYFGRIETLKGMDTLLEAMRLIPDVALKIVGDGSYLGACRAKIAADGIDNVEICGFQSGESLFDTIRGAFCTVIPSEWYENCPMSVLESLALSKAVVGTDIGGIPELIVDGEDGFVVPVADPAALSDAIARLAKDPVLSASMGAAGRNKIQTRFSPSAHVDKIRAIYASVAKW